MAGFIGEACHWLGWGVCPPANCHTTGRRKQVRQILAAMPAGRPWLFALLLWRSALRQAEALDLQWRDLNFAAAAPTITARKSNVSGGQIKANQE